MEKEDLVRPSLLSADFNCLDKDLQEIVSLNITHVHYDVMDGSFVDNISFGEPVFKKVNDKYKDNIIFDVHLMVVNPLKQVRLFAAIGVKEICFHYEAFNNDIEGLKEIRKEYPKLKIGIAFSPYTKVEEIYSLLPLFDYVLVMSVVPGKGGQKYIEGSEDKVHALYQYKKDHNLNYSIGVDGGINSDTGKLCVNNGADFLVAGAYYFNSKNKKDVITSIHS